MVIHKIQKKLKKFLIRFKIIREKSPKDYYISRINKKLPWAYIAYIADPFYYLDDENNLNRHQNRREAISQVRVLNELGYNVYVQNYLTTQDIPNIKFDIVFGHEPNFVRAAKLNPQALKIHYVPGAYIGHRNKQIIDITDSFNEKYNASIPYRRLLVFEDPRHSAENAYNIADEILLIGSKYTVDTFPTNLRHKITTIHQSTQQTKINTDIQVSSSTDFFFMGSGGNLLKGISLLIEFFSNHPELTIHFVGPIEPDVQNSMVDLVTENMKFYGFVDVNSDLMQEIMNKCNFVLYPSGSEGGMPGAVLNSMKNGLIPIVTPWAAFDEVEKFGYVLEKWDVASIAKGVDWALSLTYEEIEQRKKHCVSYINSTFSLDIYTAEFTSFIKDSLKKKMEL